MDAVDASRIPHEVQRTKRNNFVQYIGGGYNIIQRIKYLIAFQSCLGINRLYLIGCRKCAMRFCYTYNAILVVADVMIIIVAELYSASQLLYKYTVAVEYLLMAFSAFFLQRKSLNKFFSMLQAFDEKLNICDDIKLTSPIRIYIFSVSAILIINLLEQLLFISYAVDKYDLKHSMYASYLGIVVHDIELIFFSVLLVLVSRRLRVIKAHVAKVFSVRIEKDGSEEIVKLEALSKKVNLDVSSLHEAYDLLYKCAQQLKSVMTLPITVMIVASGLSTILILKNLILVLQSQQDPSKRDDMTVKVALAIGIGRSLKWLVLLMFPCHFANVTKSQVDIILTMLHDILNDDQLDKVERRKVKAFSQLCRDNAFLYELWGVVRLDMSLPLGYMSLCTTYLIIFVQFSKFID